MGILEFLGLRPKSSDLSKHTRRWLIVSNRLPFRWNTQTAALEKSAGGLVAAINSIHTRNPISWFGIAPEEVSPDQWEKSQMQQDEHFYEPVFVEAGKYANYYNGMCNSVLWPLLHYEGGLLNFSEKDWAAYVDVNRQIAEVLAKSVRTDDIIWIHDFHLMLLPLFLRRLEIKQPIGFFLHTPFPSAEVFRQLPSRTEILRGLLASDLIGFHDYSYLRYFSDTVWNVLGLESNNLAIETDGGVCNLGVFPVSIDTAAVQKEAESEQVSTIVRALSDHHAVPFRILGVDRLDYIKGIKLKFKAFRHFLLENPDIVGKVVLTQVVVPSRTDVPGFSALKFELEQMVGEINGAFARPGYVPLEYIYGALSQQQLLAFYRSSNVLLVTSRRDGMNLVALEYLAAQDKSNPGAVVLSEFTGATSALSEALFVNPWDSENTARTLRRALDLSLEDRVKRHVTMLSFLNEYTATTWANMFIESLQENQSGLSEEGSTKLLLPRKPDQSELKELRKSIAEGTLLVFCDYDGTLVGYFANPEEAYLSSEVKNILSKISQSPFVKLVVTSGRKYQFLEKALGELDLEFCAEHGAEFYRSPGSQALQKSLPIDPALAVAIKRVLQHYSIRVPNSFVEEKKYGLVWHYRRCAPEFAGLQARKLKAELESYLANEPVSVTSGKKIIEIRANGVDKSSFVEWYLEQTGHDASRKILAIGDDSADEPMFLSVKKYGGTAIRVGPGVTNADYRLKSHRHVVDFLEWLIAVANDLA